jgi:hypothetical protein
MENVRPEKVIEILRTHNVHISLEQAQVILEFMIKFARIAITKIS